MVLQSLLQCSAITQDKKKKRGLGMTRQITPQVEKKSNESNVEKSHKSAPVCPMF